jgi:hypothetical protein
MNLRIHTIILSLFLLGAALSSAQETNKFVSMPDGTKVVVLQEYASSYMVTREGEHKPFFLEKTPSAVVSPTPAQITTDTKPILIWRGFYGPTELIQGPTPLKNREDTNNALSVLTPQENERFVSLIQRVSSKLDWKKLEKAGRDFNKVAYDDLEAGMLKEDPSIKPLLQRVKAFHPFPPHTFRLPTDIKKATGGIKLRGTIVTIEKENPDSLSVIDQSFIGGSGEAVHDKFSIDKSVTNGVKWIVP